MAPGEITERSDFDQAVKAAFPKARLHRKENGNGWTDTFTLGMLQVSLRVYTQHQLQRPLGKQRTPGMGSVKATIKGVRMTTDGSTTMLWSREAKEYTGLVEILTELRAELLGMAHAILVASGRKKSDMDPVDDMDQLMSATGEMLDEICWG